MWCNNKYEAIIDHCARQVPLHSNTLLETMKSLEDRVKKWTPEDCHNIVIYLKRILIIRHIVHCLINIQLIVITISYVLGYSILANSITWVWVSLLMALGVYSIVSTQWIFRPVQELVFMLKSIQLVLDDRPFNEVTVSLTNDKKK